MREDLGVSDELRASDDDRERAVRALTRHCGDGRLTLDELEDRIAEAYAASTKLEIEHALRELPRSSPATIPSTPPARAKQSAAPVRTTSATAAMVSSRALRSQARGS